MPARPHRYDDSSIPSPVGNHFMHTPVLKQFNNSFIWKVLWRATMQGRFDS